MLLGIDRYCLVMYAIGKVVEGVMKAFEIAQLDVIRGNEDFSNICPLVWSA